MAQEEQRTAWQLTALGDMAPSERAEFYETLSEDESEEHFFFGGADSKLYENPRLEIGIVAEDGAVHSAAKFPKTQALQDTKVDVYLERYFVQAMPGRQFDLQLAVSSRHWFDDRAEPERVSHTLVVRGVVGDFTNYLAEPVFRQLRVTDTLSLDVAVTFLTDRSTERFIEFLKGPEMRTGIQLASVFNPVFGTVASYVRGIVESLAAAKRNQPITDAHLTLMADPGETSPPLIEGTYVLFQPSTDSEKSIASNLRYDMNSQRVVLGDRDFERNYLILRVKKHV